MKNSKLKILLIVVIIGIFTMGMPIFAYATNEATVIVKQEDNSCIIYVKGYLDKEFQFAFSDNKNADITTLSFQNSAKDTADGQNNIAYASGSTAGKYLFIKIDTKTECFEIDLNDNIIKTDLEKINKISKKIPIELKQEQIVNEVNEKGTIITETVGVAKIVNSLSNGKYNLVPRKATEDTDNLFALAELLEKNKFTNKYTEIKASKEFFDLKTKLEAELKLEDWKTIENDKINQPKEAETGDQYILWLKGDNKNDVHFLTSLRKYDEEVIEKEVKTILPYTYDNNTMLVVLAVVIVAIVIVAIRIVVLKKKELKK